MRMKKLCKNFLSLSFFFLGNLKLTPMKQKLGTLCCPFECFYVEVHFQIFFRNFLSFSNTKNSKLKLTQTESAHISLNWKPLLEFHFTAFR